MLHQAFIHSSHKSAYTYKARSSEVLRNSLLQKWDQSDVDPQEFKGVIRTSLISNFQRCNKHQVCLLIFPLFIQPYLTRNWKDGLTSIIRNAFIFKIGNNRYKYLVLGHEETYFVKEHSNSKNKYSEDDIIKMLEFLVDNIFVVFCRKSLPADSRLSNGYELCPSSRRHLSVFIRSGFHSVFALNVKKHLASRFNLTYRFIDDDVLSINNPEFENYLGQMYPAELEIKYTTESTTSASLLDLLLSIGRDGQLHTSIYDKRDDFNFHITNFPFLSSNIQSLSAYCVFISQLIRYARACSSYECFILRVRRFSSKLLKHGYLVERLKSSFRKFYGRYGDLVQQYEISHSRMLNGILTLDH